jgi:hypothetical protein
MVYFMVVTLSTVGYGDMTDSSVGKVFVVFMIVIFFLLIPKQTNELANLMSKQSIYARKFYKANPNIPFIIVSGHVTVPALKNFCNELFHEDHGIQDKNAVIIQETIPEAEMGHFLKQPKLEVNVTYLQGNPKRDKDLQRASCKTAKACVLLTNKNTRDPVAQDHKNILTGLAIKQYAYYYLNSEKAHLEKAEHVAQKINKIVKVLPMPPLSEEDSGCSANLRLCMQLSKPESKTHFYNSLNIASRDMSETSNDQLIIIEEIKMNLLAKSCFSPGIISMLSNLISSSGEPSGMNQTWLKEYAEGMGHEIYRSPVSPKLTGMRFTLVAKLVYDQFKGKLFHLSAFIHLSYCFCY